VKLIFSLLTVVSCLALANLSQGGGIQSGGSAGGGITIGIGDGEWLRLDAANDPMQGDLDFGNFDISNLSILEFDDGVLSPVELKLETSGTADILMLQNVNIGKGIAYVARANPSDGTEVAGYTLNGYWDIPGSRIEGSTWSFDPAQSAVTLATWAFGTNGVVRELGFRMTEQAGGFDHFLWLETDTDLRWDNTRSRTLYIENEATADAVTAPSITFQASNKTAGTGDGGNVNLTAGTSSGGNEGNINLNARLIDMGPFSIVPGALGGVLPAYWTDTPAGALFHTAIAQDHDGTDNIGWAVYGSSQFPPTSGSFPGNEHNAVFFYSPAFGGSYSLKSQSTGLPPKPLQVEIASDSIVDAVKAASIFIRPSDKTGVGSTGDGGDINLEPGTSVGGTPGLLRVVNPRVATRDLDISYSAFNNWEYRPGTSSGHVFYGATNNLGFQVGANGATFQWKWEDFDTRASLANPAANWLRFAAKDDNRFYQRDNAGNEDKLLIEGDADGIYLRLDGTNSPTAAIDWNNQQLNDVSQITWETTNIIMGDGAGTGITGTESIVLGNGAGTNIVNGFGNNIYIGTNAGAVASNGNNIMIGKDAGLATTTGFGHTILGYLAGKTQTTQVDNTYLGRETGEFAASGQNVMIGRQAGENATGAAGNNIFVGYRAGRADLGGFNTYIGWQSAILNANAASTGNVVIGWAAGSASAHLGPNNVVIGQQAGQNLTTFGNSVLIGATAGQLATNGNNVMIGHQSGNIVSTGFGHTFVGYRTAQAITTQLDDTFIGREAGENSTGANVVALGRRAGRVSGDFSVHLGRSAGETSTGSSIITLGYDSEPSSAAATNEFSVGSDAAPITSVILGEGGLGSATAVGNVTIKPSPVTGGVANGANLILQGGSSFGGTDGIVDVESQLSMSSNKIVDLADPTAAQDAMTLAYANANYNNYVHPNHTGEVTSVGDGAQTLDKTAITNKTNVTADPADSLLISDASDSGNLKKTTIQSIEDDILGATVTGQTIGNTTTVVETFTAGTDFQDDDTFRIKAECVAMRDDGTEGMAMEFVRVFRKDGAAATAAIGVGTTLYKHSDDNQWDVTLPLNGNNVDVTVKGNTGDTVNWNCKNIILTRNAT
jgi:hypothetical protein